MQAEICVLIPKNGTYRPRPREGLGRTPELGRLPILRTSLDLPETANFREQYFCGAAIQSASNYYYYYYYCLIAPPLYLTYLILARTESIGRKEIEREERKIYLAKGLHLVKRSISSKERAGGCRPPAPPACQEK